MSLSSRDEAALRSCEALLTDGDPGLAETARFFEQVVGAEPMPRNERITSWRPRPGARLVAWLPSLIALAALAAGRFAWRAAHGAVRALVQAAIRYSESLGAAEATAEPGQHEPGRRESEPGTRN